MKSATMNELIADWNNFISIHALHEECDTDVMQTWRFEIISIHALHEECDTKSESTII